MVGDVAERPDAVDIGPLVVVDDDHASVVEQHTGPLEVETVGVRAAAHRDQHQVGLDGTAVGQVRAHPSVVPLDLGDVRVEPYVPLVLRDLGEPLRDLLVL